MKKAIMNSNILKFLLLFGLEFDIRVYHFLTLRKIVFVILLFFWFQYIFVWKRVACLKKTTIALSLVLILLYTYSFILQQINLPGIESPNTALFPSRAMLQYILNVIWFAFLVSNIFGNMEDFCKVQLNITLFQSAIAIIGRLSLPFRLFIYNHFVIDDGRLLDGIQIGIRSVILGCAGATASVILFTGCICCIYLLMISGYSNYQSLYMKYVVIMAAMSFIGRTGLYFAILLFLFYMVYTACYQRKMFVINCKIGFIGILVVAAYVLFSPNNPMKLYYIDWVGEIFIKGVGKGSTIQALVQSGIPDLTIETFFGMSIIRGVSRLGTEVFSDIGYVMYYAALGLLGSVIFYSSIFLYYILKITGTIAFRQRVILLVFLICIFILEYKEPFMGKTPLLMILSTMLYTAQKEAVQKGVS